MCVSRTGAKFKDLQEDFEIIRIENILSDEGCIAIFLFKCDFKLQCRDADFCTGN